MLAQARAWLDDDEAALRRWFARAYRQPPNHPLFDAQPLAYWHAHVLADREQEAQQLRDLLAKTPAASDQASAAWRQRIEARLAELGGNLASAGDDQLAADIAAAERGELPAFLKGRIASRTAGG